LGYHCVEKRGEAAVHGSKTLTPQNFETSPLQDKGYIYPLTKIEVEVAFEYYDG
jgi:hypothetical protein